MIPLVAWDDRFYLDGTKTEHNPYTCVHMTSQYRGFPVYFNISLSVVGQNSPAHIFCPDGIFFIGRYTEVSFYDVKFYSTPISFYHGSVVIKRSVFTSVSVAGMAENQTSNASDGVLNFHSTVNLTISDSDFGKNATIRVNGSDVIDLTNCKFYDNKAGAATLFPSRYARVIVDSCVFMDNWGSLKVIGSSITSLYVKNTIIYRYSREIALILELSSSSVATIENITVEKSAIFSDDSFRASAVYISLYKGHNNLQILDSAFKHNSNIESGVGAIIIENEGDLMTSRGCKHNKYDTGAKGFPTYHYTNIIEFRNCVFQENSGQYTGAVMLSNGLTIFRNCTFVNNFAFIRAGHLTIAAGSGAVEIYNSTFQQTRGAPRDVPSMLKSNNSFIYSSSSGMLMIEDTILNFTHVSEGTLLEIVDGGNVTINYNSSMLCPVGSKLWFDNYTHGIVATFPENFLDRRCPLNVKIYSVYCERCPVGFYSLQRGKAYGTRVLEGFQCLLCPFGGNCTDNIVNHDHFWGSVVKENPPTLQFYMCPLNYCEAPKDTKSSIYDGCHGNRSGVLCGACAEGYSEDLFSTTCRRDEDCNDYWLWPVILIYCVAVAIFFITDPPIVPFLVKHIFWFRRATSEEGKSATNENSNERQNSRKGAGNSRSGLLDVVFYFYQAVGLLIFGTTGQTVKSASLTPLVKGIFNFRTHSSSIGLGCPFAGLSVITKELFYTFVVFTLLFCVFIIYGARQIWAKARSSRQPSFAPHLSAATHIALLGYTSLATSAFKLLTIVMMRSGNDIEIRSFFDGNIIFFTWWQCVLLVYVIIYVIPFVGLLYWGASWLSEKRITAREFFMACVLPLPFLLYWAIWKNKRACLNRERSQQTEERLAVMNVLYGPFRPPDANQKGTLYWESVLIARRLILIIIFAFINMASLRLLLSTIVCVVIAIHHVLYHPYKDNNVNMLETVSLVVIIVFGLFNTVHATFISAGVHLRGPIKTYVNILNWIQSIIVLLLPLALIIAVIFAVLSQIVRAGFAAGRISKPYFLRGRLRKNTSAISKRKSSRLSHEESLFGNAEVAKDNEVVRELVEGSSPSHEDCIYHEEDLKCDEGKPEE